MKTTKYTIDCQLFFNLCQHQVFLRKHQKCRIRRVKNRFITLGGGGMSQPQHPRVAPSLASGLYVIVASTSLESASWMDHTLLQKPCRGCVRIVSSQLFFKSITFTFVLSSRRQWKLTPAFKASTWYVYIMLKTFHLLTLGHFLGNEKT